MTILAYPNHVVDLELIIDASDRAVGAVLQQISCGKCQPLAFWSKALTPTQKMWSCFERELFACYASIKHFQYFSKDHDFTLKIDHKPIVKKFQHNSPAAFPQEARYIDYILQFTLNIDISGKDNIADVLSRPFEPPLINLLTPINKPLDFLELAIAQRSDSECKELHHNNLSALILKDILLSEHEINVLCDIFKRKIRPVIPRALHFSVFKHLHCLSHLGIRGSVALLTRSVIWVGIKKDVAQWARECLKCSHSKIQWYNKAPLNEINPPPSERFTYVYIDITGPLPPSNSSSYLLMIIDRYSHFIQALPFRGITAEECFSAFVHGWVSLFGSPKHIYCD